MSIKFLSVFTIVKNNIAIIDGLYRGGIIYTKKPNVQELSIFIRVSFEFMVFVYFVDTEHNTLFDNIVITMFKCYRVVIINYE